jgi:ABC-type multidrug transport system ATPase subunit
MLYWPQLLILDEPTVGVDPQSRNAILESVQGLSGEGMAVLYTTHYMEEADRLCDRVGIIDHGKLIAEGTRQRLVSLVGERDRVRLSAAGELDKAAVALASHPWVTKPPLPAVASTWSSTTRGKTSPPSSPTWRLRGRPSSQCRLLSRIWRRCSFT